MGLTNRFVQVDIYTPSHRVVGKVQVSTSGLGGLINDPTTSYLRVYEASLARIHMPTKLAGQYSMVELTKRGIYAVCVRRREDLGPLRRGGFSRLFEYEVTAISSVYEIQGTFLWGHQFDSSVILIEGNSDFLTFYDATLQATLFPNLRVQAAAALINRRKIDIFIHKKSPQKK